MHVITQLIVPLALEQLGGTAVTLPASAADVIFAFERTVLLRLHELPAGVNWFGARDLLHGKSGQDPAMVKVFRRANSIEASVFGSAPYVSGVRLLSGWRRGSDSLYYAFGFTPLFDSRALRALLEQMPEDRQLTLPGPDLGQMETYLCVQRRASGWQTRTEHPGAQSPEWADVTIETAMGYLQADAALADGSHPQCSGAYEINNVPPDPEYTRERDVLYRFGTI
jgi:hypothetical protein